MAVTPHTGFLATTIRRIRQSIAEPSIDGGYFTDAYLVEDYIEPAVTELLSELCNSSNGTVLLRYAVSLVSGQADYVLPPTIRSIHRVAKYDTTSGVVSGEFVPRPEFSPYGPGWRVEGNILHFEPTPLVTGDQFYVYYVPNGDVRMHRGTGTIGGTGATITLAETPALGLLDLRPNAYAGSFINIYPVGVEEQALVDSYDPATRVATLRRPFSSTTSGSVTYEVVPPIGPALYNAIAKRAILSLLTDKSASDARYMKAANEYRAAMKVVHESLTNKQGRIGQSWNTNTIDSSDSLDALFGATSVYTVQT